MTRQVVADSEQVGKILRLRFASWACRFVPVVLIGAVTLSRVSGQTGLVEPKPSLNEVQQFAQRIFLQQPNYREGDLVTQGPTGKVLKALAEKGWTVVDKEELLARVLSDDDFLPQLFRDERGREFLRTISNYPGGIDRVDRLSRLPQGRVSMNDLVHKIPNGTDWIKGMTTTRRGEILGERLSNSPEGHDFNEPTGRIYTLPELAAEIQARLEAAPRPKQPRRR